MWGTVSYLPWVWLQVDGQLMESQAGNLDHCAVPPERVRVRELEGGRERDGWEESKRLGDTSRVGECGAAEKNLLACKVGPRASKTPLHSLHRSPHSLPRPPQSLPTYLICGQSLLT